MLGFEKRVSVVESSTDLEKLGQGRVGKVKGKVVGSNKNTFSAWASIRNFFLLQEVYLQSMFFYFALCYRKFTMQNQQLSHVMGIFLFYAYLSYRRYQKFYASSALVLKYKKYFSEKYKRFFLGKYFLFRVQGWKVRQATAYIITNDFQTLLNETIFKHY